MIELKSVTKAYGRGESRTEVLKGISLEIGDSAFTVILGASGSGKSTLLNVMSGLELPDEGEVLYDGTNIVLLSEERRTAFRKEHVGFIFQQYYLLPNLNVDCEFPYKSRIMGTREPLKSLTAPYMARNPMIWGFLGLKGTKNPLKNRLSFNGNLKKEIRVLR